MSSDGTKPGKKTPPNHAGKVEQSGDSLSCPQSYMSNHIVGMAEEQLIEWHESPPTQSSGGCSHSCIPGVGQ